MGKSEETLMHAMARFIDANSHEELSLIALAKEALLSPAHFQKRFTAEIGLSPKEYQQACRLKKLKSQLRTQKSVTDVIYEVGHGSPSRVYGKLGERIGMTPMQFKKGGLGVSISYALSKTSLGLILIAATDRGVCFLHFGTSKKRLLLELQQEFPGATLEQMPKAHRHALTEWIYLLEEYISGRSFQLMLPLDLQGTVFQQKVWKFLQKVPKGKTVSYSDVAKGIGQPTAARAVARACASNRIAVVIPCHRVVRGSGEVSGYRWGVDRKKALLKLESKPPEF